MTKTFVVLAGIFILVGGSIGGAFVGGMIVGENRAESEAPATAQLPFPGGQAGQAAGVRQFADQIPLDEDGNPDFAALQQMAQAQGSGLPTPPGRTPTASTDTDLEETVSTTNTEEADEDGGDDFTLPRFGRGLGLFGGGATFGTIESIADGIVIINTPQGTVEATVGSETVIQVFAAGEMTDLQEGMSVTVMGQYDAESGKLDAATVIAAPEGAGAFPGLGGGFQNRPDAGGRRP